MCFVLLVAWAIESSESVSDFMELHDFALALIASQTTVG